MERGGFGAGGIKWNQCLPSAFASASSQQAVGAASPAYNKFLFGIAKVNRSEPTAQHNPSQIHHTSHNLQNEDNMRLD